MESGSPLTNFEKQFEMSPLLYKDNSENGIKIGLRMQENKDRDASLSRREPCVWTKVVVIWIERKGITETNKEDISKRKSAGFNWMNGWGSLDIK